MTSRRNSVLLLFAVLLVVAGGTWWWLGTEDSGGGPRQTPGLSQENADQRSAVPLTESVVADLESDLSSGDQARVQDAVTADLAAALPADVATELASQGGVRFDLETLIDYGDGTGVVFGSVGDQSWRFLLILNDRVWQVSVTVGPS